MFPALFRMQARQCLLSAFFVRSSYCHVFFAAFSVFLCSGRHLDEVGLLIYLVMLSAVVGCLFSV